MEAKRKAQLKLEATKRNINPKIELVKVRDFFQNASDTSDDEPVIGNSWIEYWEIFSNQEIPSICLFCGQPLNKEEADGCHIWLHKLDPLFGMQVDIDKSKYYIIPGHQGCNNKHDQVFASKIDVNAVEAIKR